MSVSVSLYMCESEGVCQYVIGCVSLHAWV